MGLDKFSYRRGNYNFFTDKGNWHFHVIDIIMWSSLSLDGFLLMVYWVIRGEVLVDYLGMVLV